MDTARAWEPLKDSGEVEYAVDGEFARSSLIDALTLYIAERVGAKYQLQNSIAPKATKCQRMSSGCVIPRIMNSRLSVARAITSARATAIASSTVVATNIIKTIYRSNHAVV